MTERASKPCPHCEGGKQCTSCKGTGMIERLGHYMACAVCTGGGRCLPCGGTGEVARAGDTPIST